MKILLLKFTKISILRYGSINETNNNELYAYDLATKKFEVFSEFPGKLRNQALSYVYNNELYVFGGGASETYSDEYKVNLETKNGLNLLM